MAQFRIERGGTGFAGCGECSKLIVVETATGKVVMEVDAPFTRKELRAQVQRLARLGKVEIMTDGKVEATGKIVGAHASGQTMTFMSVGPLATWNGADAPIEPHWDNLTVRIGKGQVIRVPL